MISWLSKLEFESAFAMETQRIEQTFELGMRLDELRARISLSPSFTPSGEDFPGPVEQWYGKFKNHFFVLTFYYHESHNFSVISHQKSATVELELKNAFEEFKLQDPYSTSSSTHKL